MGPWSLPVDLKFNHSMGSLAWPKSLKPTHLLPLKDSTPGQELVGD
jgi:hypothetical protein